MAPLRIDPVAEARRHWEERWGEPSRPMAAVTSIMRAQQVLLARLNEALVLLSYTRRAGGLTAVLRTTSCRRMAAPRDVRKSS